MRRLIMVWMFIGGLMMAGGVSALDLGTYSADCSAFGQPIVTFNNPQPGDYFTVNMTGTCNLTRYLTGTAITTPGDGSYSVTEVFTFTATPSIYTEFLVANNLNYGIRFRFNPPPPPTATTNPASTMTATGATVNGTVNDNGAATTVIFEYGTTASYGSSATAAQSPISAGAGTTPVSAALTGLTCNTTYHYRVSATNAGGTLNGSDVTFTTSACPTYTIGGTISGLTGTGLVLTDSNAGSSGAITAGATSFVLTTALNSTAIYNVTVQTQPTGQTCTVSNGSGTVANSNVTNVAVTCTNNPTPSNPIPTLSDWARILMMLAMIATAGFYGWRMKQR